MNNELQKFVGQIIEENEFKCPVCGSARYVTDQGNHEFTFDCSSKRNFQKISCITVAS